MFVSLIAHGNVTPQELILSLKTARGEGEAQDMTEGSSYAMQHAGKLYRIPARLRQLAKRGVVGEMPCIRMQWLPSNL